MIATRLCRGLLAVGSILVLAGAAGCNGALSGSGRTNVRISYPEGGQAADLLSLGEARIALAKLEVSGDLGVRRSDHWEDRLRSRVASGLDRGAQRAGNDVVILASEAELKKLQEQEDRRIAEGTANAAIPLLSSNVLLTGRLAISVRETMEQRTFPQIRPWAYLTGGQMVREQTSFYPVRRVTADCLVRITNLEGHTIVSWQSTLPARISVGSGASEIIPIGSSQDLPALDEDIREAVDLAADQFVRVFFRETLHEDVLIEASWSEVSRQALQALDRWMISEDPAELDEAVTLYRSAVRESSGDHRSYFGLGVALELQGKLDEAEKAYRYATLKRNKKYDELKVKDRMAMDTDPYLRANKRIRQRLEHEESSRIADRVGGGAAENIMGRE